MDNNRHTYDLLLDLRREFDEFRDEMRAALKKIDEDTDMLADHSMYVKKLDRDANERMGGHIKRIYDDIDMIYDTIGPLDRALFPQVNSVRGTLETIRAELDKIKTGGSSGDKKRDGPEGKADDRPSE